MHLCVRARVRSCARACYVPLSQRTCACVGANVAVRMKGGSGSTDFEDFEQIGIKSCATTSRRLSGVQLRARSTRQRIHGLHAVGSASAPARTARLLRCAWRKGL